MFLSEIANGKSIRSVSVGKLIAFVHLTDGSSFSIAIGPTGLNVMAREPDSDFIQMKRDAGDDSDQILALGRSTMNKISEFFQRESITNLVSGHLSCPNCGPDTFTEEFKWDDDGKCVVCGESAECLNEHFIASSCDCCGVVEQGMKVHATACNKITREIQEYTVCEDCMFHSENGESDEGN